jgi:hypothetical protein
VKKSRTIFSFFMNEALDVLTKAKAELDKQDNKFRELTEQLLLGFFSEIGNEVWALSFLSIAEPQATVSKEISDTTDYNQVALELGKIVDATQEAFSTVVETADLDDPPSQELRNSCRRCFENILLGVSVLFATKPKIGKVDQNLKSQFEGLRVLSKIEQ